MPEEQPPYIEFRDVSKSYRRGVVSLDALNFSIDKGEFFTLLGPSGSGKTSALMMLAGFETPTHGDIRMNGESLLKVPAYQRNFGMVFQDYALFPHLTVAENVAYPLRMRGIAPAETRDRVRAMLETVKLKDLDSRRPHTLSGGQQQRVALARALVFEPALVLLDEPLGTLDRQLRDDLRAELRDIHGRVGNTFVFVTHDQSEAMALSDRIVLVEGGQVRQAGPPDELYDRPRTSFAARFIGECNLLRGTVRSVDGASCEVVLDTGETVLAEPVNVSGGGSRTLLALRPERVAVNPGEADYENRFACRVRELTYMGDHVRCRLNLGGNEHFVVRIDPDRMSDAIQRGKEIEVCWRKVHCRALDAGAPGTEGT
jgi:putative spermidine/putrescine transport system ATP-binding protein